MTSTVSPDTGLLAFDVSTELWREYIMQDGFGGQVVYRINNPTELHIRPGGSTHRIVDADGVSHLVPGPGYRGTAIRWQSKPGEPPVSF